MYAVAIVAALIAMPAAAQVAINYTVQYQEAIQAAGTIYGYDPSTCTPAFQSITLLSPPQYGIFYPVGGTVIINDGGQCDGLAVPSITAFYIWTKSAPNGTQDSYSWSWTYPTGPFQINVTLSSGGSSGTSGSGSGASPPNDTSETLGSATDTPGCGCAGDPITLGNGNVFDRSRTIRRRAPTS